MVIYSDRLYKVLEKYLSVFERKQTKSEGRHLRESEAILFGYSKGGIEFVKALKKLTDKFIVIDYDPDAIEVMERKRVPYLYGDATDLDLLEEAGVNKARMVISNITDHTTNTALVKNFEHTNPSAVVICRADTLEQADELYGLGASYVMMPHYIGTEKIGNFIRKNGFNKSEFKKIREKHVEYLHSHYDLFSQNEN